MSGWQGGIQPSLVINFCGGRERESNVLSLMVLCVCFKEFYLSLSLQFLPASSQLKGVGNNKLCMTQHCYEG